MLRTRGREKKRYFGTHPVASNRYVGASVNTNQPSATVEQQQCERLVGIFCLVKDVR